MLVDFASWMSGVDLTNWMYSISIHRHWIYIYSDHQQRTKCLTLEVWSSDSPDNHSVDILTLMVHNWTLETLQLKYGSIVWITKIFVKKCVKIKEGLLEYNKKLGLQKEKNSDDCLWLKWQLVQWDWLCLVWEAQIIMMTQWHLVK